MDPITVVAFVAAVVQLIDVTSKVVNYFNNVKNAPKDRAKLAREATGLLALFTDLRYRVEETHSTDPWFAGLRSLGNAGGPLTEFRSAMEDIAKKLAPTTRVLHWTLDKKEIDAILSKIERLKTLVSFALQKDHFKLSLAMKEEMTVEFREMRKLSVALKEETTAGFHEMKTSRDVEEINRWLAAPLPSSNHNTAMKKRQPRTGEWFIQSKEYAEWKMGTSSSFIWLHGIPGCGKTILCSTIIQDVISRHQCEPLIAVAYFYFDFNDSDKQRTEKLIRSLIAQFAAQCLHLPESLQSAYSRSQNGQNQLKIEELTKLLRQMVESFNSTYILLDALDECKDREDLLECIEALMGWNISLLATSRKENDIATSLEPLVSCQLCIQSALVDADIHIHILERLSNDSKLKKWPVDVQKEIEGALMRGANGMFRWVVCQLDTLRKCLKLDALRRALNTLPKTLDDTYERILSSLDEEYEEDAFKIFQWLCFSARPMRLDEMVEVLAIDSTSDSRFRPEQRLPDPRDILTICSTLVSVTAAAYNDTSTTETQELKLAHFSVKEYLVSDRLKKTSMHRYHITPSSANFSIAKTCLTYLLYFESPTILTANFNHEFPFLRYAAEFWPWHYREIIDDADTEALVFLGFNLVESRNSCFINWLRIFNPDRLYQPDLDLKTMQFAYPLYYMSYLGVSGVVRLLLDKNVDFNAGGKTYGDALSAASYKGHEKVVRLLLDKGVDVNAKGSGKYGNALSAASYRGYTKVVKLLLDKGADVNAKGGNYGNALTAASYGGHTEVVKSLLDKRADVNAQGGNYGNALSAASYRGYTEVVKSLLNKGADVNAQGGNDGNALLIASYNGHISVVQLLLDKGANVNVRGGNHGNALSAASYFGHKEIVQLLLDKGADVNAEGGNYGNALTAASYGGHTKVVQLLLEGGADVNAEGGNHGKALAAASYRGHEKVVQLLLERGADVNSEGGNYGKALAAASYRSHEKVVQLLLEGGANVNAQGGIYGNALSVASFNGHQNIVQLLLDKGADVNAEHALLGALLHGHKNVVQLLLDKGADVNTEGGENGNALTAASYEGHTEVVKSLLDKGADVNAEGGNYGNALTAASYRGYTKVVKLLLDKGADVNAKGGNYGKALAAASYRGHEKVVQLLLEGGANVDAQGGKYGNALSAASSYGHNLEIVQLLLDKGADVNAEGGYYSNALAAASYFGHEKVIQLLLEKGADVNAEGGNYGNALTAASYGGHTEVVKSLLDKGADVNAEGRKNGNALTAASYVGHTKIVQLLLDKGADVNAEDALLTASLYGHDNVVQLLLDKGADVNTEGGENGNALTAASYGGHTEVVKSLLDKGADVNAEGGNYGNALTAASYGGHTKVVKSLLDKGADVNAESGNYGNALTAASYGGHTEVVKSLLDKGADVNAQSGCALREAFKHGRGTVMPLLLKNNADVNFIFLDLDDDDDDSKALQGISVDDHEAVIQLSLKRYHL